MPEAPLISFEDGSLLNFSVKLLVVLFTKFNYVTILFGNLMVLELSLIDCEMAWRIHHEA